MVEEVYMEVKDRLSWAASSLTQLDGVDTEALCCAQVLPVAKEIRSDGATNLLLEKGYSWTRKSI